jgi:hypothetical protein
MKKIKHISLAIGMMAMSANISAAEVNGAYCANSREQKGWDESKSVATFINIPKDCPKVWCAFALDGSWKNWSEIATTFTPGQTTVVTSRVLPTGTYWNPTPEQWPGGAASKNKPGYVNLALWSPSRVAEKKEDCAIEINPSTISCNPIYCDNFRALLGTDGKTIKMKGLNNCTPGNWFAYSDDGWASYADVTPALAVGQDSINIDLSTKTYSSGSKKDAPIETPLAGTLSMIADANGTGKCTADNKGGNNKNGINMAEAPTFVTAISDVKIESVAVMPNPASPSETITISGEYASDAKVCITSVSGAIVGSAIPTVGTNAMTVSLSGLNLQAGIYFMRIDSGEKAYSAKLCVK